MRASLGTGGRLVRLFLACWALVPASLAGWKAGKDPEELEKRFFSLEREILLSCKRSPYAGKEIELPFVPGQCSEWWEEYNEGERLGHVECFGSSTVPVAHLSGARVLKVVKWKPELGCCSVSTLQLPRAEEVPLAAIWYHSRLDWYSDQELPRDKIVGKPLFMEHQAHAFVVTCRFSEASQKLEEPVPRDRKQSPRQHVFPQPSEGN